MHYFDAVMEILGQAIDLEAQGHKVCHLEVRYLTYPSSDYLSVIGPLVD